jgi:hypothetical protein
VILARTFGVSGSPILRATWHDEDGNSYDADFPLS